MNSKEVQKIPQMIQKGLAAHKSKKFLDAKKIYEKILRICPNNFDALQLLGTLCLEIAQFQLASALLSKAIKINPGYATCFNNFGIALKELNFFQEALLNFDKAISLQYHHFDAHNNRGLVLTKLLRFEEALNSFNVAIQLEPNYAEAYSNCGLVQKELGFYEAALKSFDQAIAINPYSSGFYYNRGITFQELNFLEEALLNYEKSISLKKDKPEFHNNRGVILQQLHRVDEAIISYKNAIELNEEYAEAHWNLSLCNLLTGNYGPGWEGYEWRWKNEQINKNAGLRKFSQPLWLGCEPIKNKRIFLYAEQGLGDTIQFVRYIKFVVDLGAIVFLEVQPPLVKLIENMHGLSRIFSSEESILDFDYQCPLMSLPFALKNYVNYIPAMHSYIRANENKIKYWKKKLGKKDKPLVGIVWSGSSTHKNDKNRSIALDRLIPYLSSTFQYVSLQREVKEFDKSILEKHSEIWHFGEMLQDFSDTAALCELMDIILTVDTSVAHLAGAMGKDTLILLPFSPDWRWLLDKLDSPWYPTVKLLRQSFPNDWNQVMNKAQENLESLLKKNK